LWPQYNGQSRNVDVPGDMPLLWVLLETVLGQSSFKGSRYAYPWSSVAAPAYPASTSGQIIDGELQMPLANLLKRHSKLFAVALLVAPASSLAWPKPALAASPQHRDQVPGFYRM
jgi:hypothetical protein